MKPKVRNTDLFRKVLLLSIVVLFSIIGLIFVYQYSQYKSLESRISADYKTNGLNAANLGFLLSSYGEAENLFRLYTLDFDRDNFNAYKEKLDTIKYQIDSLANLPIENNPWHKEHIDFDERNQISLEFAELKRNMDYLVMHTNDSLAPAFVSSVRLPTLKSFTADSVISRLMQDTVVQTGQDTILQKRRGLIQRIFNQPEAIIVDNVTNQLFNTAQIDVVYQTLLEKEAQTYQAYNNNLSVIRRAFRDLQKKERQLITTNFSLLSSLKNSIDQLNLLEIGVIRKIEEQNFEKYKANSSVFLQQLIFALVLKLVLIAVLIFYQRHANSYERMLRQEKEYASNLAEEKSSILAGISHEIRTPLNSLVGIIDLLRSQNKHKKSEDKLIDSAHYGINIINSSINDILSLSKLEAGGADMSMEYFSPYAVFHDLITLHRSQAELKGLTLELKMDVDPKLNIFSSTFGVKQIASNFIGNAIKYTNQGGIQVNVKIDKTPKGEALYFEVVDTGIGIPEKNQEQLFRKFYSAHSVGTANGFGLGLYISKILATKMQATIDFKSVGGVGSTFFASVPFGKYQQDGKADYHYTLKDLPLTMKILVVDDNPINILFMKQFFNGFENLVTVNNGGDALKELGQQKFDAVITDINMPSMNGRELLEKIRSSKKYGNVKVVAISSDDPSEQRLDSSIQFDGYLFKPFTEREIVNALKKTI